MLARSSAWLVSACRFTSSWERASDPRLELAEERVHRAAARRILQADEADVCVCEAALEVVRRDELVRAWGACPRPVPDVSLRSRAP